MDLSSVRAVYGLSGVAAHDRPLTTGSVILGQSSSTVNLPDATFAYTFEAICADSDVLNVDFSNFSYTSTTWVAGTKQVETATAAGTITTAGNASVVVTAAGMTGSPKTISVAVALNDTAATWAGKVRTALAADTAVAALFDVGGTTTAIQLTRKAVDSFALRGTAYEIRAANDSTLNISLDNGTCAGITTAATSANTTAGVATQGHKVEGLANDFQGDAFLTGAKTIYGILAEVTDSVSTNTVAMDCGDATATLGLNGRLFLFDQGGLGTGYDQLQLTPSGTVMVKATIIGKVS